MKHNSWITFWLVFAVVNGVSSYYADNILSEHFDALLCFLCAIMARLEYKLDNKE